MSTVTTHPDPTIVALGDDVARFVRTLHGVKAQLARDQSEVERAMHTVLAVVADAGPQRVSALADRLAADPSTASRQTAELVKRGLLERLPDPDDGRACLLAVTDDGRAVVSVMKQRRHALLARAVERWDPAEVADFSVLLRRFTESLDHLRTDPQLRIDPPFAPDQETA